LDGRLIASIDALGGRTISDQTTKLIFNQTGSISAGPDRRGTGTRAKANGRQAVRFELSPDWAFVSALAGVALIGLWMV
jgi:hypothetical protein